MNIKTKEHKNKKTNCFIVSLFHCFHERHGFTMIELMVTIGIFALITGAVLANFRSGERGEILRLATEQLAQDIRRAQSDTLSGKTAFYKEESATEAKEQVPLQGYGVELVSGSAAGAYTLFPPVSFMALPKGIVLKSVQLDGVASDRLIIRFRPPQGVATFQTIEGGFFSDAAEAIVTLQHTATNQERRITMNRISGKISVE